MDDIRRRDLIKVIGGAALVWPLGARAQQKRLLVGLLSVPSQQGFKRERSGFPWGVREAEDRDFDLAEHYADGYVDRSDPLRT
jgi:hypothetical protein